MSEAAHPSLDTSLVEGLTDLDRAREIASGCIRCRLAGTRTHVVFGRGSAETGLMLVGEGPGEDEDAQGRPFVGRAGQLLDELLDEVGLGRGRVWVTNTVRCRPTKAEGARLANRAPRADEIRACSVWMETELRLVAPRAIVCLGAHAAKALIRKDFRLMAERGQWFPGLRGADALATVHPSYVLRQRDREARAVARALMRDDLALAAAKVLSASPRPTG